MRIEDLIKLAFDEDLGPGDLKSMPNELPEAIEDGQRLSHLLQGFRKSSPPLFL